MTQSSQPQYALVDLFTGEIVSQTGSTPNRNRRAKPGWVALAAVCGITPEQDDEGHPLWRNLTDAERGMLNRFYAQIERAENNAGVDDVNEIAAAITGFVGWWNLNDWRGKRGQKPAPADVAKSWTVYRTSSDGEDVARKWMDYLAR
jgi:hypothetical protein